MQRPKIPDAQFHADLKRSDYAAFLVCIWLNSKGYRAQMNKLVHCPNYERRHEFTDDGDIKLLSPIDCEPYGRVEVKHWPKIQFTSRESIPYPKVFVDEVYQIERKHSLDLVGYAIVNKDATHVAMISADTSEHWIRVKRRDSRYRTELEWYACPRRLVKVAELGVFDDPKNSKG